MSAAPAIQPARNLSLYEISVEYDHLLDAIQDNGGEVTAELETQLIQINEDFDGKVEKCALYITSQRSLALAAKNEAKRLDALATLRTRSADALELMLKRLMELTGKEKVVKPLATVSIVTNGGKPAVKWVGAPEDLPAPYRTEETKIVYGIDRDLVIAHAELKKPLPLGLTCVRDRSLRIK